jgi:hypothetical protein
MEPMIGATEILTAITLGISAWTLRKVVILGEDMAALKQQVKDLPCLGKKNCSLT